MGIDEQMVDAMSGSWLCQSCEDSMLYCVCQKPFDEKLYIGCEGCEGWFHPGCCGLTDEEAAQFGQ